MNAFVMYSNKQPGLLFHSILIYLFKASRLYNSLSRLLSNLFWMVNTAKNINYNSRIHCSSLHAMLTFECDCEDLWSTVPWVELRSAFFQVKLTHKLQYKLNLVLSAITNCFNANNFVIKRATKLKFFHFVRQADWLTISRR